MLPVGNGHLQRDHFMKLWTQWLQAARLLRPACQRSLTFVWMALVLMGLCCRSDNFGVTSFVRVLNLRGDAYRRFLHLFHSKGLDLNLLTSCWVRLCLVLFRPFEVGSRLVCLADGIKVPKEGLRMPGVKSLHQESQNNTKPEYIMGHSLQAVSLLVHSGAGQVAAIPMTSRIHEGLVFSNRDSKTLLDKLVALLLSITLLWNRPVILVADAYYASGKVIKPLLDNGHHLLTRAKSNAVAYQSVPKLEGPGRGRPKTYGQKVRLKDIWARTTSATRPSVNVQSIPRFLALHLTTLLKSVNKKSRYLLDNVVSPCKPPGADPHAGWCGRGASYCRGPPMPFKAGLIDLTRRAYFVISDRGRAVLASPPPSINIKFLETFPAFKLFREGSEQPLDTAPAPEANLKNLTPDEIIRSAHAELDKSRSE